MHIDSSTQRTKELIYSWTQFTTKTRGEPLNVIISGASDPFVLTDEGFMAYVGSIGYARECMGLHMGA
jgi:hypothetical protein